MQPTQTPIELRYVYGALVLAAAAIFLLGIHSALSPIIAYVLLLMLLFNTLPAWLAARERGTRLLLSGGSSGNGRRSPTLRRALVAGQVALSLSLLAGSGLLVRSLLAMTGAPLGFDPDGVLTVGVQLPSAEYPTLETRIRAFAALEERVAAMPGVAAVASALVQMRSSGTSRPTSRRSGSASSTWPSPRTRRHCCPGRRPRSRTSPATARASTASCSTWTTFRPAPRRRGRRCLPRAGTTVRWGRSRWR